jgi:hypothetical protein
MNRTTLSLTLSLALLVTAPAHAWQMVDDVTRLADPAVTRAPGAAPNPALYAAQNHNAAVMGHLVDQTPQYQEGHTLRVEAAKQQERNTEANVRRQNADALSGAMAKASEDAANAQGLAAEAAHQRAFAESKEVARTMGRAIGRNITPPAVNVTVRNW